MDNVKIIGEGTIIHGSILCSDCSITEKCDLKDCLVGHNHEINTAGKKRLIETFLLLLFIII
jgi:ADP-glucose pyrophosphorylase